MATIAELVVKLLGDTTDFDGKIDKAKGSVRGFGDAMKSAGGAMVSTGQAMTKKITLPIVGIGVAMSKVSGDFESQMNVLSVAARESGTSMDELSKAALKVGADTELVGISAAESAEAMEGFYKSGLTTAEIMGDLNGYLEDTTSLSGALRGAIDLAAASELNLANASDLTTITMKTFGFTADEVVGKIGNYVQAADASVASVSELAAAMRVVGPTMASFGFSLEDTNTALAILSERGIKGSEAGNALKASFLGLMSGTDKSVESLEALGVTLYDAEGQMRSMPEIFGQLSDAMAGMTDEQRNFHLLNITGSRGLKVMQTMLAEGREGWNEMEAAINGAATMQESAAARTQGLNAAVEQLMGAVETFMIVAGTPLIQNVITPMIQQLGDLIGRLAEADPQFLALGLKVAGFIAVAGPVVTIIGHIVTAIGAIIGAVSAVGGAFAAVGGFITTAVGGIVAAITAIGWPIALIVAAVAGLYLAWRTNFLGIRDLMLSVKNALIVIFEFIKGIFRNFLEFLRGEITWTEFTERTINAFKGLKVRLGMIWNNIKNKAASSWNQMNAKAASSWAQMKTKIATTGESIKNNVFNTLVAIVESITGNHAEAEATVRQAWARIKAFLFTTLTIIKNRIRTSWNTIKWIVKLALAGIREAVRNVMKAIRVIITAALQTISGNWRGALQTLKTAAINHFKSIRERILSILSGLVSSVYEKGKALADRFGEGIKNGLQRALDAARSLAAKLRALLPGSDAKTGPLSDLLAAGKALPSTFAQGIILRTDEAEKAVRQLASRSLPQLGFEGVRGPRAPQLAPSPGLADNTRRDPEGGERTLQINIHNPIGEPAEESIARQLRNLAALGVLEPV